MYVFVDVETTGLDYRTADLLEIAILIADDKFQAIDEFEAIIHWEGDITALPDIVQKMHEKTGLWDKCANSTLSVSDAEDYALGFLEGAFDEGILNVKEEMAGNTISFDRGILLVQMPQLFDMFHYRNIDVSTLKVLAKKYGHPAYVPPDAEAWNTHMALSDCYDSLRELEYYTNLFGIAK